MDTASLSLLKSQLTENNHDLFIFSSDEFAEIQQQIHPTPIVDSLKTAAGYTSTIVDTKTALNQVREFGIGGRIVEKNIGGKRYVILKGFPGLRKKLKGTRYLASNAKVVSLAIGKIGVNKSVVAGARLTIFLTVPLTILKYLIDEQSTLSTLIGSIASDIVKIGISSVLAMTTAAAVGTISTLAAGPLVAAIFVGIATAVLLEKVDEHFGLTEALIKFIDKTYASIYDKTFGALARNIYELERILIWQARNRIPVGKGIFY